jgi:hypothetical protein
MGNWWSGIAQVPDHFCVWPNDPISVTQFSIDNIAIRYIFSPTLQVSDDGRLVPVILFKLTGHNRRSGPADSFTFQAGSVPTLRAAFT